MPVVKNKKTVITVLVGCALILTGLLAWKIISQTGSGSDSFFHPESNYGYPKLEFQLDDNRLAVQPGENQELAAKILFEQLGFQPNWDELYLPNLDKQDLPLQPHTITFTIKHISRHSPDTHGPLFASFSKDGRQSSGFTCSEGSDLNTLDCNLFLNEAFFEETDLQKVQSYATNYTVSALLMLTQPELSPYGGNTDSSLPRIISS